MVDKSSRPEKTVNYESTHRTIIPQKPTIDKAIPQIPVPDLDPHLNPEYNFDTFIEGYSNKLSRSVAEAVALNPAKTIFNPLFLYGASGVGKPTLQCHRHKNQGTIPRKTGIVCIRTSISGSIHRFRT